MASFDNLKNPLALALLALGLLAAGLFVGLKFQLDESDAAALARRDGDKTQAVDATASLVTASARATSANAYDETQGFIVPYRPDCPPGAERRGAEPPTAFKEWCERTGDSSGIKHGWYAEWFSDGRPATAGEYKDGLRVGVWTRWYPNGKKRVQAEFKDGLQDGRLMSWDENGAKQGEQLYAKGQAQSVGR